MRMVHESAGKALPKTRYEHIHVRLFRAILGPLQFWKGHRQDPFEHCASLPRHVMKLISLFLLGALEGPGRASRDPPFNEVLAFECCSEAGAGIWQGFPKTWSARDGATEPYMDVFTGVFRKALPDSRLHPTQRPRFSFELQDTPV